MSFLEKNAEVWITNPDNRIPACGAANQLPDSQGIYAIFSDRKGWRELCMKLEIGHERQALCREYDGLRIIYIGIAKKSTLKDRLGGQDLRNTGPSTFFRSLGAALGYLPPAGSLTDKPGLKKKPGNYRFDKPDTASIIRWIDRHLVAMWEPMDGDKAKRLERKLIKTYWPILNLAHIGEYKVQRLFEKRRKCRDSALGASE